MTGARMLVATNPAIDLHQAQRTFTRFEVVDIAATVRAGSGTRDAGPRSTSTI